MSVELNTQELGFRRPFTREVSQVLRLKNPHHGPLVFKVKTTAPKHYCVRPNHGRIEAGEEVEVQVLLQAKPEDVSDETRSRDKFLVQSVAITADQEFDSMTEIWQHVEKVARSSIQEKKIRVVFLPPEEANGQPRDSLAPAGVESAANPSTPSKNLHEPEAETPPLKTPAPIKEETKAAAAPISQPLPTDSSNDKRAAQVAESELRQRKSPAAAAVSQIKDTAKHADLAMRQAQPEGVPVNIVFILCLLSFLIGYLFF